MPTSRKPDRDVDNLMLIIGQLLESSKAAADGLKSLGTEVRSNATSVIQALHTIETMQIDIAQIDRIVRDAENPAHLVGLVGNHGIDLVALKTAVGELRTALNAFGVNVAQLNVGRHRATGIKDTLWFLVCMSGWAVTTGVALYAALK